MNNRIRILTRFGDAYLAGECTLQDFASNVRAFADYMDGSSAKAIATVLHMANEIAMLSEPQ